MCFLFSPRCSSSKQSSTKKAQEPFPKVHFWFGFFFFGGKEKPLQKGPFQSEKRPKSGSV
jgi:hypothetical protein